MRRHTKCSALRTDSDGRVLVLIQGGVAWVVTKLGQYLALADPGEQLGRHLDMSTDKTFAVGTSASEPGWSNAH